MPTHKEMVKLLRDYDFFVGVRDPKVNTDFKGRYMVVEDYDPNMLPTKDGSNGPWAIVGDDLEALVREAYEYLDSQL